MAPRKKGRFILLPVILGTALSLILAVYWLLAPPLQPSRLFAKYVLTPIPQSVENIKVDQCVDFRGYGYTFSFHTTRADLALVLSARPFRKVSNVAYDRSGYLRWDWSPTFWDGIVVYGDGQRAPAWFAPEQRNDPEAYAFQEGGKSPNTQVLLYNEEFQQAYFMVISEPK